MPPEIGGNGGNSQAVLYALNSFAQLATGCIDRHRPSLMKTIASLIIACAFAVFALAAEDAKKAATPPATAAKDAVAPITMLVSAAKITAPFVIKDGALAQPAMTDVTSGGKAVFTFTVAKAGDYVVHGLASAPDDDNNSFFLNIDAEPTEPLMIWDIEMTNGFEERVVGWRGN